MTEQEIKKFIRLNVRVDDVLEFELYSCEYVQATKRAEYSYRIFNKDIEIGSELISFLSSEYQQLFSRTYESNKRIVTNFMPFEIVEMLSVQLFGTNDSLTYDIKEGKEE